MDKKELAEYIDQHRWLLNNGLVSDDVKNQLFFCGSIVHKDVRAVELDVVPESKSVTYKIYVDIDLLKKIDKYHQLSKSKSLFGLWRFKRFLLKEGTLNFQAMLSKFVSDFCGSQWSTKVEVIDFDTYVEGLEKGDNAGTNQQSNKLPDK